MFSLIPTIIVPLHLEGFVSDACEHSFFFKSEVKRPDIPQGILESPSSPYLLYCLFHF